MALGRRRASGLERYNILKKLGAGAQGVVSLAQVVRQPEDWSEDYGEFPKLVAIKKMKLMSLDEGLSRETIREIYCTRELHNEYVIQIYDIFHNGEHIHMVMPYMKTDLDNLIRSEEITLRIPDIKRLLWMILKGVGYCHDQYILHRDLKPGNCLVGPDKVLKISDFGLAREFGSPSRRLSYQACTIWYRAPELLFGSGEYTHMADMWSVGCIFGELMLRVPLFQGQNDLDQLARIFSCFGTPDTANWEKVGFLPKYQHFNRRMGVNLTDKFPAASALAIDLFKRLCALDPNRRLSAAEALEHGYFKEEPLPTPIPELQIGI